MAKDAKRRIINTAFYLFLKKGYAGVTLKDIISATGLSKGAIYHHFESKYAIYLAALEEYFFKILGADFPPDAPLPFSVRVQYRFAHFADLMEFVETLEGEGIAFPIRSFFIFQLESEKDAFIRERVEAAMDHYRQEIRSIVQQGQAKGEVDARMNASVIAQQLMSMLEGLALHHSAREKNAKAFLLSKYEEVVRPYLDLICRQAK